MRQSPNPQGKGLVPVLQGLQDHWSQLEVPPKHIDQISLELFTSLFVLQSEFRFNPVPHTPYWMYENEGKYRLMLVAPEEWCGRLPGRCIGLCELQNDRTWTLQLQEVVSADQAFMARIEQQRKELEAALENAETLDDAMPSHEPSFGYYGRGLAFILGRSLRHSMQLSGINALAYQEARGLLTHEKS